MSSYESEGEHEQHRAATAMSFRSSAASAQTPEATLKRRASQIPAMPGSSSCPPANAHLASPSEQRTLRNRRVTRPQIGKRKQEPVGYALREAPEMEQQKAPRASQAAPLRSLQLPRMNHLPKCKMRQHQRRKASAGIGENSSQFQKYGRLDRLSAQQRRVEFSKQGFSSLKVEALLPCLQPRRYKET